MIHVTELLLSMQEATTEIEMAEVVVDVIIEEATEVVVDVIIVATQIEGVTTSKAFKLI